MSSFRTVFSATESQLAAAGVWCGHGYVDHHDEAIALVLAAAGKPLDSGADILGQLFPETARPRLMHFVRQRVEGRIPVAYIIGEAWLGPCIFRADPRALVPRSPIAEVVLRELKPWWGASLGPDTIIDVCCGGGSLGILAAHVFPEAQVTMLDIDPDALSLAAENLALHQLGNTALARADLLSTMAPQSADIILANPPYVDAPEMAALPREYNHEPRHALAAGETGLDLVHILLRQAERVLSPNGLLFLEVGNTWEALEKAYPTFDFVWIALESGGYGVCVLSQSDLARLGEPVDDVNDRS